MRRPLTTQAHPEQEGRPRLLWSGAASPRATPGQAVTLHNLYLSLEHYTSTKLPSFSPRPEAAPGGL